MANENVTIDNLYAVWKKQVAHAKSKLESSTLFDEAAKKRLGRLIARNEREIVTAMHKYRRGKMSESKVRSLINNGLGGLVSFI